ncbi:hypothetical protein [Anaerofustis stercorihominis]|uniref:DUF3168 domain-containing protein n=1 Tax=Anaerofustis stercorihominis TaxID=214853 RepID=A0A3E3DUF2_9FIRM|nr:hypothetical protein [Anaerofustis stercorihominis]RGD72910.1 hypothetical protein DW687_11750 [Anaerofustis stercorihominis]
MIEEIILNYLNENLEEPVFMERPEEVPSSYIILEKIGSSMENYIYRDVFAIQSYGKSLLDAAELNEKVKSVMNDGLIFLDNIASVKCINDYNFTDTTTKQYRYQAIYDIVNYK